MVIIQLYYCIYTIQYYSLRYRFGSANSYDNTAGNAACHMTEEHSWSPSRSFLPVTQPVISLI